MKTQRLYLMPFLSNLALFEIFMTTVEEEKPQKQIVLCEDFKITGTYESKLNKLTTKDFKITGTDESESKKLTIQELLYSAIIGVLGGIISSLIPFGLLIKVWYPLVGGQQLIGGHHLIWASIVYGLTRKKRAIFFTMFIKGILEFMLGDVWGILIIFVNLMEGTCLIIGFIIMEKIGEGETKLGWGLAGGIGNFFQAPFFWTLYQRWSLHWTLCVLAFIFAFISGVLITGVLGRAMKNTLVRSGVPTTF